MSVRSVLLLLEAARTWLYSNYTLTRAVGENGVTPETRLEDSLGGEDERPDWAVLSHLGNLV